MKTINGTHMKKMLLLAVLTVLSSVSCHSPVGHVVEERRPVVCRCEQSVCDIVRNVRRDEYSPVYIQETLE